MINIDFLQIGFQKCGTTYFDEKVYPGSKSVRCLQAWKYPELERLFIDRFILPDGFQFDPDSFKKEFLQVGSRYFPEDTHTKINGIIFEPFTFLYQRRFDRKNVIDRIYSMWPDAKIILFVRNQKSWLISHYSQYIKSGGLPSLTDFIECQLTNPNLDAHYIDFFPLVAYIQEIFSKKQFRVYLYEELKESLQAVVQQVFSFLGAPAPLVNPDPVNRSLSSSMLAIERMLNYAIRFDCGHSSYSFPRDLRGANLSLMSKMRHQLTYRLAKPIKRRCIDKIDTIFDGYRPLSLSLHQEKAIEKRYHVGNRMLAKLLDCDLEKHGYPV